jgi:hypothetical protein
MYIRKSISAYHGRTICSLGDLSPRPREAWIELARKIEDALIGQSHLLDTDESEVADIVHRVRARRRNEQHRGKERPPPAPPHAGSGALIKVDPTRVATERHREAGPPARSMSATSSGAASNSTASCATAACRKRCCGSPARWCSIA